MIHQMRLSVVVVALGTFPIQDDGKGGLGLRGVAFMTVLAVLTVLESTLSSSCLCYKIQYQETTVTVLAVSAAMAVLVVTATRLKLNTPSRHPENCSAPD